MGVISVRLSDEEENALRRAGLSPGRIAKEALLARARALRIGESLAFLARYRRKPSRPVADLIREIRDEH